MRADVASYVPKALYRSLQKRNAELRAEVERLERARGQLAEEAETLIAALRSALVLAEIHERPWDERDSAELDRLCRLLDEMD